MPIDIESFTIAKDPTKLILQFLSNNFQSAFTLDEIYDNIEEIKNLNVPIKKIEDTLDSLYRYDIIQTAVLNDEIYYAFKTKK